MESNDLAEPDDLAEAINETVEPEEEVTAEDVMRVTEFVEQVIRESPGLVYLPRERWDHVIHSLEENIDQLRGPPYMEPPSGEELDDIKTLEETLESIMEQVTEAAMDKQRRVFTCGPCGAEVLANAPPAGDDDDPDEWPVCQGRIRFGDKRLDVHERARMTPAGRREGDDGTTD